ncbi:hypothetical protein AX16_007722 [Volvariella volvacea WC 439]|nr:hypothetical protein AX16_007722 [Volvariella volvacea WC 439]
MSFMKTTHARLQSSTSEDPEPNASRDGLFRQITSYLSQWGVETRGITPVPPEERTDQRLYQMFFVWFSANFNILAFSTGSAGPVFFSLGIKQSLIVLLVVDAIACIIPAYFAVFGPKLGTRAMVQARFSWGYYGSMLPSLLNVFSSQSFLILNCIIGGQALAAVSDRLNATLGIVIIGVLSLIVTFCGYKVIHIYESWAWIPNAIAFPVMLGLGGRHLRVNSYPVQPTPTPAAVLSFGSLIASSVISWCTFTPDYGVYHSAKASTLRIFAYTYAGFFFASLSAHMMGAAFAAAAPGVPSWNEGFDGGNSIGGLVAAILEPSGGFGKFLLVIIALSIPSACAPTMYSFGTSFMAVSSFFEKVPRYIYALVSEAILIPLAIIGATRFYLTLVNILSVIGYWSTAFASIILTEHLLFRHNSFSPSAYPVLEAWNRPKSLPLGVAALTAFAAAFGIIVPSMSQTWYEGPIARSGTGDVGVLLGFVGAGVAYAGARWVERRWWGEEAKGEGE